MALKRCFVSLALYLSPVILISCQVLDGASTESANRDLARLLHWFSGEYNNNEQVWQQGLDKIAEKKRHKHIHSIVRPIAAPSVGRNTFFVKQYLEGDPQNIHQLNLYDFSAGSDSKTIRLIIYTFIEEDKYLNADENPELLEGITQDQLEKKYGCDIFWTYHSDYFLGETQGRSCLSNSDKSGDPVYVKQRFKLSSAELLFEEQVVGDRDDHTTPFSIAYKNRKVSYFKGWAAVRNKVFNPNAKDPEEMAFFKDLRLHNEGQRVRLVTEEGIDTGYALELVRLTYQRTQVSVLKFGLIENSSGKTITYIWGNPEANRLGMNLRWLQSGITRDMN